MTYRRPSRPPHSPLDTVRERLIARRALTGRDGRASALDTTANDGSPARVAAGWLSIQQPANCPSPQKWKRGIARW